MSGVVVLLLAFAGLVAGDAVDDFSNNLATDLAPVLALFGDQVTKQFLSESTTVWDSIIFACAPIGILTAVVSVIRVCGSSGLRAFIGRAQESTPRAEVEVCSSTSRDVCELYQNGAIVRVLARHPKILELVHVSTKRNPDRIDSNSESESDDVPGELTSEENHHHRPEAHADSLWTFGDYRRSTDGSAEWQEQTQSPKYRQDKYPECPNLSLNVGDTQPSTMTLVMSSIFGVLIQLSVIGVAFSVQFIWPQKKEDEIPPVWGLSAFVAGTISLCGGMFGCATLINACTVERVFLRNKNGPSYVSRVFWIQPGGQAVGDITFDAFIGVESPNFKRYTSSRRAKAKFESFKAGSVTLVTMLGFVLQFVGLRSVHSSVCLAQLAAILVMSFVRACLRSRRPGNEANVLHSDTREEEEDNEDGAGEAEGDEEGGYELNYAARTMLLEEEAENSPSSDGPRNSKMYTRMRALRAGSPFDRCELLGGAPQSQKYVSSLYLCPRANLMELGPIDAVSSQPLAF
jgi:hypothetical protein